MGEIHDDATETAETAAATAAETVAPGSTESDGDSADDSLTVDRVRDIAREVVDAAMADLKATVAAEVPVTESEPESFSTPKRVPWTHKGSHH